MENHVPTQLFPTSEIAPSFNTGQVISIEITQHFSGIHQTEQISLTTTTFNGWGVVTEAQCPFNGSPEGSLPLSLELGPAQELCVQKGSQGSIPKFSS